MKKVLFTVLVLMLVFSIGFGFFATFSGDGHHHESRCPYMPGEYAICPMSVLDHLVVWKKTFTQVVVPMFAFFVASIFVAYFYYSNALSRIIFLCRNVCMYVHSFRVWHVVFLMQTLFSSGILNPKVP